MVGVSSTNAVSLRFQGENAAPPGVRPTVLGQLVGEDLICPQILVGSSFLSLELWPERKQRSQSQNLRRECRRILWNLSVGYSNSPHWPV
jgi:hypothetical protein